MRNISISKIIAKIAKMVKKCKKLSKSQKHVPKCKKKMCRKESEKCTKNTKVAKKYAHLEVLNKAQKCAKMRNAFPPGMSVCVDATL